MNQPPITDNTPVMRYTALSRPQARSANEVPIATMKATYVVDKGNFKEVPKAISNPDKTTFTEARTKSKLALSSMIISLWLKRLSIQFLTGVGTILNIVADILLQFRTNTVRQAMYRKTPLHPLTRQIQGSLHHVLSLLEVARRLPHDPGTHQEIPRCLGRSQQGGHQKCIRGSGPSLRHQVHIRGIASQGDSDKVHQVIPGKSQRQGKRTPSK